MNAFIQSLNEGGNISFELPNVILIFFFFFFLKKKKQTSKHMNKQKTNRQTNKTNKIKKTI